MTNRTLAEDLALLLLDDTGRFSPKRSAEGLFAGALMFELAALDRLELFDEEHRLFVQDSTQTSDNLLNDTLARLGEAEGSIVRDALGLVAVGVLDRVMTRLVAAGLVREEKQRRRLLFSTTVWPLTETDTRHAFRARLHAALAESVEPDHRTELLLAYLHSADLLEVVSDQQEHAERAESLTERLWARHPALGVFAEQAFQGSGEGVIPMI
ncbi:MULTISPECIES: GPP34 family phosphoprotein [unclassified Crossiella]|uniref:GOLPH3/VPS74 family protein n=1 Tax=unclassified Crossiella TaxID=2620835 RepID=UPI001FFF35C4|nr:MULTISPECIES: GPP34 family phosphoprotein [unclassified Crossiella]MCK2241653.1 GPP34 family phosphoprotein [Crossiella sp. S99.2]MCK2255475.1 GPP34 family phosphoprotein [Crossiella sp. S99.1]